MDRVVEQHVVPPVWAGVAGQAPRRPFAVSRLLRCPINGQPAPGPP
jgi:hypothetical protein